MAKNKKQRDTAVAPKALKPAGTRMGILEDWRASGGKFREKNRRGKTLRDGQ